MRIKKYDPKKIEAKWQKFWAKNKTFEVKEDAKKQKFYSLIEFPYPSGEGLHVGHPRPFTAMDVVSRKKRMEGYNVLYPIGFDAFGLPTENFAIKTGRPPAEVTKQNIKNFTRQLKMLGYSFDWSRQVDTTDPKYYKWTQWIFLQFFKHGLAYKKAMPINWCPSCKIGLANEEVVDGKCERCGSPVEKRNKEQWMLAITKYAEKLLKGLKTVDYIPQARIQQENWIGKSEGAEIDFRIKNQELGIKVFTTRPDTLFGVTYMVVAPEHPLLQNLKSQISNLKEVEEYVRKAKSKSDLERTDLAKDKTGVELKGIKAVNPVNNAELPIFTADYVLTGYGTGAIMAVPAHDQRDWEFAKKYNLPVKEVLKGGNVSEAAFTEDGELINSEFLNGLKMETAINKMISWLEEKGLGQKKVQYKLRDWVFSRQRYWGEPIPLVNCKNCAYKKPKILHIHGIYGDNQENWIPWLKKTMTAKGYEVITPNLPHNTHPTLEEWLRALGELKISQDDRLFVVGHSLGAPAACQFVLQHGGQVEKLILVGPTGDVQGEKNWANLRQAGCDEESLECIRKFNKANKNLSDVKKLVKDSVLYLSDNDPYIPLEVTENYKDLGARVRLFKNKGHFNARAGLLEFPEILTEFPEVKKQKVLLIHGFTGRADKNWMPFMKAELEKIGFEVFVPTMTTSEHPILVKWLEELLPIAKDFGEDDVIVGHSLGGQAALKLMEQLKKKIGHLFLVAPAVGKLSEEEWAWKRQKNSQKDYDLVRPFWEAEIDFEKIKNKIESAAIIYSGDDESVKARGYEFWPRGWEIKQPGKFGHFTDKGYSALFEIIKESKATGWIPVPEKDLPLKLPKVKKYEPTDTGESPLSAMEKWVKTKCPKCGGPAKRETDTMPNWAGSSWYFLRYCDPHNDQAFASMEKLKYWLGSPKPNAKPGEGGVDWYNGGMEHTVLHLLYSRFWHQFLYDLGVVPSSEPYQKRTSHGMILAQDGEKMSKSRGNVINPDEMVEKFGADALRTYIMFMGPFDQAVAWDTNGLVGVRRFLERVWQLAEKAVGNREEKSKIKNQKSKIDTLLHQTIKKVTEDIEGMRFNTAIAQMMILANEMSKQETISNIQYPIFLKLLSPFAPHLCEELWSTLGNKKSISLEKWPAYDPALIKNETITLAVQINGKLRDTLEVPAEISDEEAKQKALESEKVQRWLEGRAPKKIIYVKGKLISIVV